MGLPFFADGKAYVEADWTGLLAARSYADFFAEKRGSSSTREVRVAHVDVTRGVASAG